MSTSISIDSPYTPVGHSPGRDHSPKDQTINQDDNDKFDDNHSKDGAILLSKESTGRRWIASHGPAWSPSPRFVSRIMYTAPGFGRERRAELVDKRSKGIFGDYGFEQKKAKGRDANRREIKWGECFVLQANKRESLLTWYVSWKESERYRSGRTRRVTRRGKRREGGVPNREKDLRYILWIVYPVCVYVSIDVVIRDCISRSITSVLAQSNNVWVHEGSGRVKTIRVRMYVIDAGIPPAPDCPPPQHGPFPTEFRPRVTRLFAACRSHVHIEFSHAPQRAAARNRSSIVMSSLSLSVVCGMKMPVPVNDQSLSKRSPSPGSPYVMGDG